MTVFYLSLLVADRGQNHGVAFNSPGAISALTATDDNTVAPRTNAQQIVVICDRAKTIAMALIQALLQDSKIRTHLRI